MLSWLSILIELKYRETNQGANISCHAVLSLRTSNAFIHFHGKNVHALSTSIVSEKNKKCRRNRKTIVEAIDWTCEMCYELLSGPNVNFVSHLKRYHKEAIGPYFLQKFHKVAVRWDEIGWRLDNGQWVKCFQSWSMNHVVVNVVVPVLIVSALNTLSINRNCK